MHADVPGVKNEDVKIAVSGWWQPGSVPMSLCARRSRRPLAPDTCSFLPTLPTASTAQVSPDHVLTLSAERKHETREGSEEEGTLRIERSYGSWRRSFRLPDNTDVEGEGAPQHGGGGG